jgi:fructose-bisphosphate aldolase class I
LGVEGLGERLQNYSKLGLKFAKWRSLFKITDIYPSKEFLDENLNRLVFYAKTCLENGFVPLLEPEISMKGNHTTTRCGEITELVLLTLFEKLKKENIDLKKVILKTNMILPGQDGIVHAEPLEVAEATLRIFRRSLPEGLPGVVFLSGGQTPDAATQNLNEIEKRNVGPWKISFSFARALQGEGLNTWHGEEANVPAAQELFINRLEKVSLARQGKL